MLNSSKLFLFVFLMALASSGVQATTAGSGQCDPNDSNSVAAFDAVYWAAQPPAVRALNPDANLGNTRGSLCLKLATAGYTIDNAIMCWAWDPCKTMSLRITDGYTWVPSALQPPVECAPGFDCTSMGIPNYNPNNPPAGSIKVSASFADYPSLTPAPTPAPVSHAVIGVLEYGNVYGSGPGDSVSQYPNGATYTDAQGTFTKTVVATPFGYSVYWTLN